MFKSQRFAILSLITSFIILPYSALAGNVHGTFRVVKGNVQVKSPNGKVSKARIGAKVFPKDTIITDKDSRAKIVMIDDNVINVSPASEIVFEKYEYEPSQEKKEVLIDVIYGKVRSKVNQKYDGANNKFRVKTPSAVAGVRGTDFFTSFNKSNNTSSVVTFEGEVAYGLPGPNGTIQNAVSVKAGQMASSAAGKPPRAPRALPRSQLVNMDKGSDADKSEGPNQRQPADDVNRQNGDDNNGKSEEAPKEEGGEKSSEAKGNEPEKRENAENGKKEGKGPRGPGMAPGAPGMDADGSARGPASVAPGTQPPPEPGFGPAPGGFVPDSGSMLVGDDLVGGGSTGFVPESNYITGNTIPDFNAINTDASKDVINNLNPCVGTCSDIIRDVIEGGNSRLIIRITNQ